MMANNVYIEELKKLDGNYREAKGDVTLRVWGRSLFLFLFMVMEKKYFV